MDMGEKAAGKDRRPASLWVHAGHESLQHSLILVVVAGEGQQLASKAYFYSEGQLRVLKADQVPYKIHLAWSVLKDG